MTMPIVKTATASDEAPAIDVVVRAFSADPAARWTWPDSQQYLMHFPRFVQAFGGKRLHTGAPTPLRATPGQRCGFHPMSTLTKTC